MTIEKQAAIACIQSKITQPTYSDQCHMHIDQNETMQFCCKTDCPVQSSQISLPSSRQLTDFSYGINPEVYKQYHSYDQEKMTVSEIFKLKKPHSHI